MDASFIHQRNELILKAWAAGMKAKRIAQNLEITSTLVYVTVSAARSNGDVRAARRRKAGGEPLASPNGPKVLGHAEYQRRRAAEKRARAFSYADGSAWA